MKIIATLLIMCLLLSSCEQLEESMHANLPPSEPLPAPAAPTTPVSSPVSILPLPEPAPPAAQPQVIHGSGSFIQAPEASSTAPVVADGDKVTLSFVNADLREVLRATLGDILKLNYAIDPQVQGQITIATSSPIERSAVLPMLEAALRPAGVALVSNDGMVRAVPLGEAPRQTEAIQAGRGPSGGGYGIRIVPLRYVGAEEMQRVLEPLAPPGGVLSVDKTRNLLVLAGTSDDVDSMLETIGIFDVDWLQGMSFAIFPLRYARAEALVAELNQIFGSQMSPIADIVRLIPVKRMNAILAMSMQAQYVAQVRDWIARLDKGSASDRRIYVYRVQNGRARDIAKVLAQTLGAKGADSGTGESSTPEGEGSATQPPGAAPSLSQQGAVYQQPVGATGMMQGQQPTADQPTELSIGTAAPGGATEQAAEGPTSLFAATGLRITADDANNALVILATASEYEVVEAALQQLDVMPMQVMIEAAIAEVTLTDELRYGVQWFLNNGDLHLSLSNFASGAVRSIFPGFNFVASSNDDIGVVLSALDSKTRVRVISSPQLMVLNNQTATLQVGDQVPVATQSAVNLDNPEGVIVNSIQFRDTGVILHVTPRVSDSGLVLMDIEQEVSDVVPTTTSGIDSPTIQQRRVSSTVAISAGQTVALGGLIRDNTHHDHSGIPILKDIPYVGAAFGSTADTADRTELLVLITPRVVRNTVDARAVTEELRARVRATQPLGDLVK
jgi:general secretion pathway protein D